MARLVTVYADSHMDYRKTKGVVLPLPYLIRPRGVMSPLDTFGFYNDYPSDDESDEVKTVVDAMETCSLSEGLENECDASLSEMDYSLNDDEKDAEYVVVDNVEALASPKKERAGAIQMMDISRDGVNESASDEAGSSSGDEWVVV